MTGKNFFQTTRIQLLILSIIIVIIFIVFILRVCDIGITSNVRVDEHMYRLANLLEPDIDMTIEYPLRGETFVVDVSDEVHQHAIELLEECTYIISWCPNLDRQLLKKKPGSTMIVISQRGRVICKGYLSCAILEMRIESGEEVLYRTAKPEILSHMLYKLLRESDR